MGTLIHGKFFTEGTKVSVWLEGSARPLEGRIVTVKPPTIQVTDATYGFGYDREEGCWYLENEDGSREVIGL